MNPPPDWGNPYHNGELTLLDHDHANCTGPHGPIEFTRTNLIETPFECE